MPRIIVVPFTSSNTSLPVLSLVEPPIQLPEVWNGLQFWFDTAWAAAPSMGQYAADHPVVAWRSQYFSQMLDASQRLSLMNGAAGPYKYALRRAGSTYLPLTSLSGYPHINVDAENKINGQPSVYSNTQGVYFDVYGAGALTEYLAATSADYTLVLTYKCAAGATGGLYGQGAFAASTDAATGQRFGFPSTTNPGTTLYQHKATGANQLSIARDTANDLPTLAIIRCSLVGGAYVGSVRLVNNSVVSDHAFSFAENVLAAKPSFGNLDVSTASKPAHRQGVVARLSRKISDGELEYLTTWMQSRRGPF